MSGPVYIDCQTLNSSRLQILWREFYSLQAFNNSNYMLYLKLVYLAFYFVSMVSKDIAFN